MRCMYLPVLAVLSSLAPLPAQQYPTLTLVYVNDSHDNIAAGAPRDCALRPTVGGLGRLATWLARERRNHGAVVALHAGDLFVGDPMFNLFFAVPQLQLLGTLGFDAIAVGNHEFDFTPTGLLGSLATAYPLGAPFRVVAANIDLSEPTVRPLSQYIQPYTILDRGGVRVGIFGMTTPTALLYSQPSPVGILTDLGPIAAQMVGTLQAAGCDVVIMLSHLGSEVDEQLAAAVPGIHVVVCGHDHYEFTHPRIVLGPTRQPVYLVQTAGFNRQVGKLELQLRHGGVELKRAELIDLDGCIRPEPAVEAQVDALVQATEQQFPGMYTTRVGYALGTLGEKANDLDQPGRRDTPLGNEFADALQAATGTDLAIAPGGATAQPIYRGPIVPADLFRAVGYGYDANTRYGWRLATFQIRGLAFWYALEGTLAELPDDSDLFVQVSDGVRYTYDPGQPVGSRLQSLTLHGAPLDPGGLYSVTTNEFVLQLLFFMGVPMESYAVRTETEFEVLRDHVARRGVLVPFSWPPRVRAVR